MQLYHCEINHLQTDHHNVLLLHCNSKVTSIAYVVIAVWLCAENQVVELSEAWSGISEKKGKHIFNVWQSQIVFLWVWSLWVFDRWCDYLYLCSVTGFCASRTCNLKKKKSNHVVFSPEIWICIETQTDRGFFWGGGDCCFWRQWEYTAVKNKHAI